MDETPLDFTLATIEEIFVNKREEILILVEGLMFPYLKCVSIHILGPRIVPYKPSQVKIFINQVTLWLFSIVLPNYCEQIPFDSLYFTGFMVPFLVLHGMQTLILQNSHVICSLAHLQLEF